MKILWDILKSYRNYISDRRKVPDFLKEFDSNSFPIGNWDILSDFKILLECCLNSYMKFFYSGSKFEISNRNIVFLREKIATYMAYLNFSIQHMAYLNFSIQSSTKMPPWHWRKYPAQCYISVWTILFVCWIIFFLNYWANIIITNYCLHTCNSTLLFRLLS